jgi:cytochrome c oxidase cbb3-type subunit 3
MPTGFWAGWVAVLTATGLATLTWVILSVYFSGKGEPHEKSPVWDATLTEGSNAPPLWWFWLILSALVVTVTYLVLYPGFGNFPGVMGWSMAEHMEHSEMMYMDAFKETKAKFAAASLESLQADPVAMSIAEHIFKQNCAACHGANAQGQANTFPNLRDKDWQWGGEPAQIEETIRNGREPAMPAHKDSLGETRIQQVVAYVMSLSNGGPSAQEAEGQAIFGRVCAACHGRDAKGNMAIGALNLTDTIWRYGGSREAITNTVTNGRNGEMPSFQNRLDDAEIHLLIAWLLRPSGAAVATLQ